MNFVRILLILAASSLFLGCGTRVEMGAFNAKQSAQPGFQSEPQTTGHITRIKTRDSEVETIYTVPNNNTSYNEIVLESQADKEAEQYSDELSKRIKEVNINKTEVNDSWVFSVEVILIDSDVPMNFSITTEKATAYDYTPETVQTNLGVYGNFKLALKCYTDDCNEIFVRLSQYDSDRKLVSRNFSLYSIKSSFIQLQASNDEEVSDERVDVIERINQRSEARTQSTYIVNGASYTTVTVFDPENIEEEILSVTTPIAVTNEASIPASTAKISGADHTSAELSGNNLSGKYIIDFTVDGINHLRALLTDDAMDISHTVNNHGMVNYENSVLPISLNDTYVPVTLDYIDALEKYRDDPTVNEYINRWQNSEDTAHRSVHRSRLQSMLNHLFTFRTTITAALNHMDAPTPLAYMSLLESNYFNSGSGGLYDAKIIGNPSDEDSGAFQITTATCTDNLRWQAEELSRFDFRFYCSALDENNKLKNNDSRGFYMTSLIMAASFGKFIFENHLKDPGLVPVGYNAGPWSVSTDRLPNFLARHRGFKVSLKEVAEFNMAPASAVDYAYLIVAAQIIGSNPEEFGFNVTPVDVREADIANFYPENFSLAFLEIPTMNEGLATINDSKDPGIAGD